MGREQRANDARREAIRRIAERVTGHFVDKGEVIALGFAAFIVAAYDDYETMPLDQLAQLRAAYFAGAQHLFASIGNMMDAGDEPTEADMRRMALINHELNAFVDELKQRLNVTDPDVGPPAETKQ